MKVETRDQGEPIPP
uniref:Uncharacterized protein n=1 Tax=Anguilla anguilla TaxID=7936 RepID=A0A0E9TUC2_ANGAN